MIVDLEDVDLVKLNVDLFVCKTKWSKILLLYFHSFALIHHIGLALIHNELTCCNLTKSNKAALTREDVQGHKTHTWLRTMAQLQQNPEQDLWNLIKIPHPPPKHSLIKCVERARSEQE